MALRNSVPSKPHVSVYFGLAKTLHCCTTLSANKQGYAYISSQLTLTPNILKVTEKLKKNYDLCTETNRFLCLPRAKVSLQGPLELMEHVPISHSFLLINFASWNSYQQFKYLNYTTWKLHNTFVKGLLL